LVLALMVIAIGIRRVLSYAVTERKREMDPHRSRGKDARLV
jgi:hypothetical protein